MTTAIDTSVLIAIFKGEGDGPGWKLALLEAAREGSLLVSPIVYAELAAGFSDVALLDAELARLNVFYSPIEQHAAFAAGQIFREYRRAGGPRAHMIPVSSWPRTPCIRQTGLLPSTVVICVSTSHR